MRYVTINREPVEYRFKHVAIQIGWDAKTNSVSGMSLYEYMSEGNLLSLEKFRWYFFIFILPLYKAY